MLGIAVNATVLVPVHDHVVLEDVQDTRHLREDEHAMPLLLEPLEELVDHVELPAVVHQVLAKPLRTESLALEDFGKETHVLNLWAENNQSSFHYREKRRVFLINKK